MSKLSIAPFFPWRRMKVAYQSVPEGSRSALVRLEPDQRYRPRCHACGRPAQTVHSATQKFVRDLSLADFSLMLQIEYRKTGVVTAAACGSSSWNSWIRTNASRTARERARPRFGPARAPGDIEL